MARASPLPALERRAAIIAAAERLIVAQGSEVTTRAIAEAVGIAEGTIFRVFPTKDAIIDAVFAEAFSREAGKAELAAVNRNAVLEVRLLELVTILQRRIRRILSLCAAMGFGRMSSAPGSHSPVQRELNFAEITAILAPDQDQLRVPPLEAARLLLAMVMALTYALLTDRTDAAPGEIVSLLLNGIAIHPVSPPPEEHSKC